MKLRMMIVVVAAWVATPAVASNWWWTSSTGKSSGRTFGFIDADTIRETETNKKTVWQATWYERPQATQESYTKFLYSYDCSNQSAALLSWVDYDRDGDVLNSKSYSPYTLTYEPVVPDTVGDSYFQFVCSGNREHLNIGDGTKLMEMFDSLWKLYPRGSKSSVKPLVKKPPRRGGHRVR